ncbi:MAG: asparagine synthase (glutamine-hydrolyzing) [Burkholderiales bacterium]|nr:asparagine synthase (glutamine-hydrolyzing) [Burkholderiales bacterium]
MCGIVTLFSAEQLLSTDVLASMTHALRHRGPDDFGYAHVDIARSRYRFWRDDLPRGERLAGVLFGHRRLSILDLSSAGRQPMTTPDRSLVVAYNGEIYNFLELRDELRSAGVEFRTETDTEVLLRAYERWGSECFLRFNGMWALTLWDGRRKVLLACRDRFGVKPMYWAAVEGAWVLASEIKSVRHYPGADRGADERRLRQYLATGAMDQDGRTCLSGIEAVPAGSYLTFAPDGVRTDVYWRLPAAAPIERRSHSEWATELRGALTRAAQIRTRSDVPVGTMLSGGIDSTAIAALVATEKARGSGVRPDAGERGQEVHHAFSACWPGWSDDEESLVERMADRYSLSLHRLYAEPRDSLALLPAVVEALDEPFESPVCLIQYQLMKIAREAGVSVVLNGHGSDELLGGYVDHLIDAYLRDLVWRGRFLRLLTEVYAFRHAVMVEARSVWRSWRRTLGLATGGERLFAADRHADGAPGPHLGGSAVRRRSIDLFTREFIPRWLRMEDRMSMAWSVESRLPFMDYRLVELALRIPDDSKLRAGYGKHVLRTAMADLLPPEIAWRRAKVRFSVPLVSWFRGGWRPYIEEMLLGGDARIGALCDRATLERTIHAWLRGDDAVLAPTQIWRCLSAEVWLRSLAENASSPVPVGFARMAA